MVEIEQLAKELGVSPSYIYKKIRENKEALGLNVQRVKTPNGKKMKLTSEGVDFIVQLLGVPTLEPIDQGEQIAKLQKQNSELLEALNLAKDKIITLQEQNGELLLQTSRIALLESENNEQGKRLEEAEKSVIEANKEIERIKGRTLWQRIRNK